MREFRELRARIISQAFEKFPSASGKGIDWREVFAAKPEWMRDLGTDLKDKMAMARLYAASAVVIRRLKREKPGAPRVTRSAETLAKMAAAQKASWAKRKAGGLGRSAAAPARIHTGAGVNMAVPSGVNYCPNCGHNLAMHNKSEDMIRQDIGTITNGGHHE